MFIFDLYVHLPIPSTQAREGKSANQTLEAIPLALGLEESRPATTLHAHSIWTGFLALDQWPLEQLGQQQ